MGIVWLFIALLTRKMSRYWSVVLGTLRGVFLLGILVGSLQQPEDLDSVLHSIPSSLIGAIGGALWGYYDVTHLSAR
ncbi:MAG: hypothetical protein F6J95_008875 [Leptolyngbya sp. SIO1E4]|nr:hypothetical protein [Leptolyngbya sp. SIO1E4]